MNQRMDRTLVQIGKAQQLEERDNEYWKSAPLEEKLRTINFLRESFYGSEATTGRLHRVFEFVKQK